MINRHSVISANHYQGNVGMIKPKEIFEAVHDGRHPKLLMDIHSVSEVNKPNVDLSKIEGPAHSRDFRGNNK
jgi:NADH-quinone oxidoreductase subunit G